MTIHLAHIILEIGQEDSARMSFGHSCPRIIGLYSMYAILVMLDELTTKMDGFEHLGQSRELFHVSDR